MPIKQTTKCGFTLIEVIISIATFSIIMLSVMYIFGTAFSGYRETRNLQHNLESAQFAMNTMAKELRTSSVVRGFVTNPIDIQFIDYSQNGGKGACIAYWVDPNTNQFKKWSRSMTNTNPNTNRVICATLSNWNNADYMGILVEDVAESAVRTTASDDSPRTVGKVTVRLRIGTPANNQTLQSSVSLRDFNFIDI